MDSTSLSLLERLRGPNNAEAWRQFVQLYSPLLVVWAKKFRLADDDAADLIQEVFVAALETLPSFHYDPSRRFRGWLWTVAINKHRERLRRKSSQALQGDVPAATADDISDEEYRQYFSRRALELMQSSFQPNTWKACWETVVEGREVADVAKELGMSARAVYVARCRVLGRLRHELRGLFD